MSHPILTDDPQYAAFAKGRREASAVFDKAVADQQARLSVYAEACDQAATNGTAYPPAPESAESIQSRFRVQSNAIDQAETDWLVAHREELAAEVDAREDELMADAAASLEEFDALTAELRALGTTSQTLASRTGTPRPEITTGLQVIDVLNAARNGGRVLRSAPPAASSAPPAPTQSMFKTPLFQRTSV